MPRLAKVCPILLLVSAVSLPLAFTPTAFAADKALSNKEIYARTLKATAWVLQVKEKKGDTITIGGSGSGSVIDVRQCLVLTNYHVVGDSEFSLVVFPTFDKAGKPVAEREFYLKKDNLRELAILGKVLARDKGRDLAVIQLPNLPQGVTALKLAKESLGPGETVHSIGNPGASGALWAYTPGNVKAVYQKKFKSRSAGGDEVMEVDAKVVETTSPVNPGDSGGPVVNEFGDLAAVTQGGIFGDDVRSISFFIDVSEVRAVLKSSKIKLVGDTGPAPATVVKTPEPTEKPPVEKPPVDAGDAKAKQAVTKLGFAKDLIAEGKTTKAIERLNEIIQQFSDTDAAKEAKELLTKLKK